MKFSTKIFLGIILLYVIFQSIYLFNIKQIPGPIYGGDYYYSNGIAQAVKDGQSAFSSVSTLGGVPHYMGFYSLLVGNLAYIFNMDILLSFKITSIFFMLVGLMSFFVLANKLFKDEWFAILSTVLCLPIFSFPIWKYTYFSILMIFPLFCLCLYNFYDNKDWLSTLFLGLVLGIMALSQMVGFMLCLIILGVFFIYELFNKNFKSLLNFFVIGIIGIGIGMIYWYEPIFVYHLKSVTPLLEFDFVKITTLSGTLKFTFDIIKMSFFNFTSIFIAVSSLLFLGSTVMLFFLKEYSKEIKFIILLFVSGIVGVWHFILSELLVGISIPSINLYEFIFPVVSSLLIAYIILSFFKDKKIVVYSLIGLVVLFGLFTFNSMQKTDRWMQAGLNDLGEPFESFRDWTLKNTNVNDVFVSNLESQFMISSLTGRKTTGFRMSHAGMFVDGFGNNLDNALLLYSNNTITISNILEKRNVKYLYWDVRWFSLEFSFDDKGQIVNTFDPILLLDTPENRRILSENGINFYASYDWVDPASRHERFPKFNILTVLPSRGDLYHPWSETLDPYLVEVWDYQNISKVYKINEKPKDL